MVGSRETGCLTRRQALLLLLGMLSPVWATLSPSDARADDDEGDDDGAEDNDNGNDGGDDNGGNAGDGGGGGDDREGEEHGGGEHDDDRDNDHEYALRQRERGELHALDGILKRVRRRYGGQVLEVKLRRGKGRMFYEIRVLDRNDRVRKVRVPASRKVQNFRAGHR